MLQSQSHVASSNSHHNQQQQLQQQQQQQRGSSAKHSRSKSTSNNNPQAATSALPSEANQLNASTVTKQQNQPMTPVGNQSDEPPKRTLKPKDLNNRSTALQTNDSRKCVTPLAAEKEARKKSSTATTRPSSKDPRSKTNKININSPEKYYTAHQSRMVSQHTDNNNSANNNSNANNTTTNNQGLVGSASKPTKHSATWNPAHNLHNNTTKNASNTLRGSVQSKLNTSLTNPNASFTNSNNKEVLQLLGPHAIAAQPQNPRKASLVSAKNGSTLPHSNKQPANGIVIQPSSTTTPSASAQLNGSFAAQSGNNLHMKTSTQTRQRRANKSVHQSSSSSSYNNAAMAMANMISAAHPPAFAYQYQTLPQRQNSSQTMIAGASAVGQPSLYHQRTASNYISGSYNFPQFIPPDVSGDIYTGQPQHYLQPQVYLPSNQPHQSPMLSMTLNQNEDASFIYNQVRFPMTTGSYGTNPIMLMHPSQSSDQANAIKKKVLPSSASTANSQNLSLSQSLYQQQLQVQQQLLDQCNLAQENEKAMELLSKGKQSFKDNNIEAAQKLFMESLKLEPMLLESQYLLGVCYLSTNQYQKAVEQFCDLLEKNEFYKRNIYLLIAIAYKKTNVINAAIHILGKAIQQYPKYYDAYIYRGKLQVKMKRFDKAIADFEMAIRLNSACGLGYMGKADCLRFMNDYDKAIELYSEALAKEESIGRVAILKRAITYIETKNYHMAMTDLQLILDEDPCNSEAYYFKGLLYYKQSNTENLNEAILSFEQAIKHNNSRKAVTKALFEISKIKIELRDFYQAYHTLQRAEYLNVDIKSLEKFRIFTDGVTFLMKRKHKEGIKHLTNLVKNFTLSDFIKPLVYSYRAYGYFCLSKHQKALNDLQFIETFGKLEKPSLYNKIVCEGIIAASNNQFELAMNQFNKVIKSTPLKMEPYFYKAMTLIRFSNKLIPKTDEQKRLQYQQNALKSLDKAVELNNTNYNLYYHRGVIRFSLKMLNECIADFNEAVKGEENQAKHHYARGIAYACCLHLKQAVHELSYAIQYNPNLANAYLNRAKCFHLLGEKNSAFLDLQQYISMKQNDPDIHLWSGNLLFNIGAYADAIKTYSNANNINRNADILLLRAKCFIVSKELNQALDDFDRILELQVDFSKNVHFDKICLSSLKTASNASSTSDPQEQEAIFMEALATIKATKSLSKSTQGTCFRRSDYYFFKGVYCFYLGDYEKTLRNFKKSFELKTQETAPRSKASKEAGTAAAAGEADDDDEDRLLELQEFEFTNRTYNMFEFYFNCAVCYILLGEFEHAYQYLIQLQSSLPDEERMKQIEILFQILNDEHEQSTDTFEKRNELIVNHTLKHIFCSVDEEAIKDIYELQFFPSKNRLCSIFPKVHANFKIYKDFAFNLYFCLPQIDPPSMKPCFDESLLESLTPTVVEEKPEAPWIRKTSDGIMFTENVQHFADLDLKTESTRASPRTQAQEPEEEEEEEINHHHDEDDYDDHNDSADDLNILASAGITVTADPKNAGRDPTNANGKKAPFDYMELMKDNNSPYIYQDYKDIDYSYDGADAAGQGDESSPPPVAAIEKSKLKDFLKLDDDIEKKLAKMSKKTAVAQQ